MTGTSKGILDLSSGPNPERGDPRTEIDDVPEPVLAEDIVPGVDDPKPTATYKDWDPAGTKIVTYRVGNNVYPGKYAETRDAAKADCELLHGRIYEANYVHGRAFFRVKK